MLIDATSEVLFMVIFSFMLGSSPSLSAAAASAHIFADSDCLLVATRGLEWKSTFCGVQQKKKKKSIS